MCQTTLAGLGSGVLHGFQVIGIGRRDQTTPATPPSLVKRDTRPKFGCQKQADNEVPQHRKVLGWALRFKIYSAMPIPIDLENVDCAALSRLRQPLAAEVDDRLGCRDCVNP